MKQPKKLTRKQKIKLSKEGYNPEGFMLLKEDVTTFTVISKIADKNGNQEAIAFNK